MVTYKLAPVQIEWTLTGSKGLIVFQNGFIIRNIRKEKIDDLI